MVTLTRPVTILVTMNLRIKKLVSALVKVSYVATQLDRVTRKIGYSVTPEFKGQPESQHSLGEIPAGIPNLHKV